MPKPKYPEKKRSSKVLVAFTPGEYELVQQAAHHAKEYVATYIHEVIVNAVSGERAADAAQREQQG